MAHVCQACNSEGLQSTSGGDGAERQRRRRYLAVTNGLGFSFGCCALVVPTGPNFGVDDRRCQRSGSIRTSQWRQVWRQQSDQMDGQSRSIVRRIQ